MNYWYDKEGSRLGDFQREVESKASCTFCVLPWIHLATRPNGDMRLCCTANASGAGVDHEVGLVKMEDGKPANFARNTPLEAFNNDYMKSVRTTMLKGEIPASCKACFDEESQGMLSKRVWETATWMKDEGVDIEELIAQTNEDGTVPDKLQYLDLRLGHTCNIKCVMCSPHDSSKWVADHKKLIPLLQDPEVKRQMQWDRKEFNNKWHEKESFWKELYAQVPNLKQVYFAGGEPLMIKEHKMFIKEIIRQGYQNNILLRYNSNGILVDNELIELWSKFRKVKFAVSVDASFERDDYIRFPTKFADVERTLHMLDNTPDNIHISMATAVQIFNIKHMPDFIKWKIKSNFKKMNIGLVGGVQMGGGLVNIHLVHIPTFLNITILPEQDKQEVRERFAELKTWLWENYTQDDDFWIHNPAGWSKWEGLLAHMDSKDNSHLLPGFKEYVNKLDGIRGLDASKIFPELSHLL
jgi:organic radical activating enzyme|tara:strand:+ start:4026 stop:5429 length:1404 start_codon:yes stop_codon:yes gene_type:complete